MKKLLVLTAILLFAWSMAWAAPEAVNTDKEAAAANSPTIESFLQQAAAQQIQQAPPPEPYVQEQPQYGKNGEQLFNGQTIMLNNQNNGSGSVPQGVITSTLMSQNFYNQAWAAGTPPGGWSQLDSGTEGTNNLWWVDKWHKFYSQTAGFNDTVLSSMWTTAYVDSIQSTWAITPSFDLTSATACTLYLKEYYDNVSTTADSAAVLVSTNGGTNWTQVRVFKADSTTVRTHGIVLNSFLTQADVRVGFLHRYGPVSGSPTSTLGWCIDSVRVRTNAGQLWLQDFSNTMSGWFGDTPPAGWSINANGSNASRPKAWNNNDWVKRTGIMGDTGAAITYVGTNARREFENDYLISPGFTVGAAVGCTLSFAQYFSTDNMGSSFPPNTNYYPHHGYVLIQTSPDGGTTWGPGWDVLAHYNQSQQGISASKTYFKYALNAYQGQMCRIAFRQVNNPDLSFGYWYLADIKVLDYSPVLDNVGTSSLTWPLMATEGRNWPIMPKVFNNGLTAETFQDSAWIYNTPLGTQVMGTGFENGGSRPAGWNDLPGTSPWLYGPGTAYGPGTPHGGSYAAYYNIYSYTAGTTDSLISPSMDLSTLGGSYFLNFWYWHSSGSDSTRVYLDEAGTKTLLWRSGTTAYAAWTLISQPFASVSANAKIYFVGYSCYGSYNIYLDDVSVNLPGVPTTYFRDGMTVSSMPALSTQVLTYPSTWNNPAAGNYTVKTWTAYPDSIPADSMVTASVVSYAHTGAGGPDAGGYTYKDDITGGGGAYNWRDISSVGTPITFDWGTGNARYSRGYPLGFSFWYYGANKTRLYIAEDGYVSFDTMTTYYNSNYAMPYSSSQANQISWFWDDLIQSTGTGYFWSNNTDSAIVEFDNWGVYATGDTFPYKVSAQVIFSKNDGKIKMQYKKFDGGLTLSHTIGIQNSTKLIGLNYVYNGAPMGNLPFAPLAITFNAPQDDITANYILSPTGFMQVGQTYPMTGRFKNPSANAQTFDARMTVSNGISDAIVIDTTIYGIVLNSGDSVTVNFGGFVPATASSHVFTMTATNPGDENPGNNTVTATLVTYARQSDGGPDAAGYKWKDSYAVGGPTFNWVDMSAATWCTFTSSEYGYVPAIPMGGSFYYYGVNYDSVSILCPGYLEMGRATTYNYTNVDLPATGTPNKAIYFMWDDMYVQGLTNGARYWNDAVNNRFVVEYPNIQFYPTTVSSDTFDCQIILNRADSSITMQYRQLGTFLQTDATIGIENATGTVGLSYYYNATELAGLGNYPVENLAIRYWPDLKNDDIAATGVSSPAGTFLTDFTFPVSGTFANPGLSNQTFDAYMTVKNSATVIYADTVLGVTINAGLTGTVNFDSIKTIYAGVDTFILEAVNPGDELTSNNVFRATRTVNQHYGTGGPDGLKYKWIDNTQVGGPVFGWIDTTGFTTVTTWNGTLDDGYTSAIPMGSPFNFYGIDYSNIYLATNGAVTFDALSAYLSYSGSIPSTVAPNNLIDFSRMDMYVAANATKYFNDVINNRFIVSYDSIWDYNTNSSNFKVQIILDRNDSSVTVQYRYISPTFVGTDFTVGVENATGTVGLSYYDNNVPAGNRPVSGLAVKYYVWHPDVDAAMISHQKPATELVSTAMYPAVTVRNNGSSAMAFDVKQVIVGPFPATTEAFSATETTPSIPAGTNLPYTFTASWTPAATGKYTVYDSVFAVGEQWPSDNQITATCYVVNSTTLPVAATFEGSDGGFVGLGDWQWGAPAYATGPDSLTIPSPVKLWGTNLTGPYTNGILNSLYFPAVALTGGTNFKLSFNLWLASEAAINDGANLKISTDNGITWAVLETSLPYDGAVTSATNPMLGQQVWGGNKGWTEVIADVSPYTGQTIMLRLDQASNSSTNYAGLYIDNVDLIVILADVGVASIDEPPAAAIIASGSYTVKTTLRDYTPLDATFTVYLEFDAIVVDSMVGVFMTGNSTQQVTWPTPFVVTAGSHTVRAFTVLDVDSNAGNDSKSRTYNVIDKVIVPYTQNFDGTELVVPPLGWQNVTMVGTNLWVNATNKSHSSPNSAYVNDVGTTNDDWLITPPIDLSSVPGAKLQFYEDQAYWSTTYQCHHSIMVIRGNVFGMTDTVRIADWTPTNHPVYAFTGAPIELGLTQFNGETIWIAFRYQSSNSADEWYIDDVSLIALPEHEVGISTILAPTASPILNGGTYDLVARIFNTGATTDTFEVNATDDHGFDVTQTVTGLAPFTTTDVTFPGWAIGTDCDPYIVNVEAELATDPIPGDNTLSTTFVPANAGNTAQAYDTGIVNSAWRYLSPRDIIANRFEPGAANATLTSIAFKFTNKNEFPTWPDANRDSVVGYIFIDADNNGVPDANPIFADTFKAADFGWTVWPISCQSVLPANCQSFWAGWASLDSLKPEGILIDAVTDNATKKWVRAAGSWSQYSGTIVGDNFIRAYFNGDTPTPPGMAFGSEPAVGEAVRMSTATVPNSIVNSGAGCDLRYSVSVLQGIGSDDMILSERSSAAPDRLYLLPGEATINESKDVEPITMITQTGAKGSFTEPQYPPMTLGSGGPDAGGYRWKDSDAAGGPVFDWVDISSTGTTVTLSSYDSGVSSAIPMGMSFNFYGANYSNIYVGANGAVTFISSSIGDGNSTIPSSSAPNAAIYAEWDDLMGRNASPAYAIKTYHDVAGNRFIVSWLNWDYYYSPYNTRSFQIILNGNDNSVVIQYATSPGFQTSGTVGIENDAGTIATQVVYNAAYLHSNLAIKFWKPIVWLSTNISQFVVPNGQTYPFNMFMSAVQLLPGTYQGGVVVSSNDPINPVDTLFVNFTVNSVIVGETPAAVAHTQEYGTEADYVSDFSLTNAGTGTLTYTATNTKPWITLNSYSGSVPPGGSLPFDIHVNTTGLLAGVYTDSVTFTTNDPFTPIIRVPRITITVTAPNIGATPASVARSQETDGTMTYVAATTLTNTGTSVLNWTAINSLPWITPSVLGGTIPVGGNQPIDLTVNTAGITPGVYTDHIVVTSNDPDEPTKSILVTITVSLIGVNPDHITLTLIPNQIQTVNVNVGNGSAVPVRIDVETGSTPWLSATPGVDTIPANGNVPVQVSINTYALDLGTYNGNITIHSSNLTTGVIVIPVEITLVTPANIVLYPFSLAHIQESGTTVNYASDFTIYNIGVYPLIWSGICDLGWVTLPVGAGSVPASGSQAVDVMVNTTGVTPGIYSGSIAITSNDPVAPLLDLPITITVSQVAPTVDHLDFTLREREVQTLDLIINNGSAVDVPITLGAVPSAWLSVDPADATIPAHGSVTAHVTVDATALTEGSYSGTVTITSGNLILSIIEVPIGVIVTRGGCDYVVGDANNSATFTGLDVTYSVRFFKGGPPPPFVCECTPGNSWYVAGDVNGSCSFTGLDITYMVRYFKGGAGPIPCPDCPPAHIILKGTSSTQPVIGR